MVKLKYTCIVIIGAFSPLSIIYFVRNVVPTKDSNFSTIRSSQQPTFPLPPVHINSSWMGNQWIPPPGYRIYSTREIQSYLKSHSILWVGDSTARRMYGTLYSLLNQTKSPDNVSVHSLVNSLIIDVNKSARTEECNEEGYSLCRKMPQNRSNHYDHIYQTCLGDLGRDKKGSPMLEEWVHKYTLVIFALGPWEIMDKYECGAGMHGRMNQTDNFFKELFQLDENKNTNFVWRTWGSPGTTHFSNPKNDESLWHKARAHNDHVKMLVEKNDISRKHSGKITGAVSYLDWGEVMFPRLYPAKQRISGDIDPHYGLEARVASIQMLMNHLVEIERQKELEINPWLPTYHADNYGYDDPEHFMTISAPASAIDLQEREELEKIKLSFCGDCSWGPGSTCNARKSFIAVKYRSSEREALLGAMENPSCNKTLISGTVN